MKLFEIWESAKPGMMAVGAKHPSLAKVLNSRYPNYSKGTEFTEFDETIFYFPLPDIKIVSLICNRFEMNEKQRAVDEAAALSRAANE